MEVLEGGDICILIANSHCYAEETNTTLESNYPPIKKKKRPTFLDYLGDEILRM